MADTPRRRPGGHSGEHPLRDDPWSGDPKQRPPFEPGNTDSVIHGAQSERLLAPMAAEIEAQVVRDAPWTARPAFAAARKAYAIAEARCIRYREHFQAGEFEDDGTPKPGAERWDRAETTAKGLRRRLALDVETFANVVVRLAGVERGDGPASAELDALRAEIAGIDAQIEEAKREELTDGN